MKVVKSNENRIKCLRKLYRLSQTDFAEKYNVAQTAVSNWEKGRNSIDIGTASQIAEDYKVPVEFVYGFDFQITRPLDEWRDDEKEDMNNAHSDCSDFFLFRYGKGIFPKTHHSEKIIEYNFSLNRTVTEHECRVLDAYRAHPEMQPAVDRLLGITQDGKINVYEAAASEDKHPDRVISIKESEWEELKRKSKTDQNLS